jgi:hypothetical protein
MSMVIEVADREDQMVERRELIELASKSSIISTARLNQEIMWRR